MIDFLKSLLGKEPAGTKTCPRSVCVWYWSMIGYWPHLLESLKEDLIKVISNCGKSTRRFRCSAQSG